MTLFQKAILKRIDLFLKMFSNLLIILTNESSFKSKTNKEIKRQKLLTQSFIKAKQNEKNNFNINNTIIK